MNASQLPPEVRAHLPNGYEPEQGVWLVLPWENAGENCITAVNRWLPIETSPYPVGSESVIWFGADGVGNWLGWDASQNAAILWNPHDEAPFWRGSVTELWQFILGGYCDAV
jgi:hypothetical protein